MGRGGEVNQLRVHPHTQLVPKALATRLPHRHRLRLTNGSKETRTGTIELITASQDGREKQMADPVASGKQQKQLANAIASLLSHLQVDYIPDK